MGLEEQDRIVSVSEFGSLLTDAASALESYQQPISDIAAVAAEHEFRDVSIQDEGTFTLTRGRRITKKTINANKGSIPVFSSSKSDDSVLGHVSEDYLKKNGLILFTEPAVLVNIDGSVGHCFVKRAPRYSFIDVVAALQPISDDIDLDYLKIALQERLKQIGATYETKLYFGKMTNRNVTVRIPIKEDGSFDIEAQRELAKKYQTIEDIRQDLREKMRELSEISIDLG